MSQVQCYETIRNAHHGPAILEKFDHANPEFHKYKSLPVKVEIGRIWRTGTSLPQPSILMPDYVAP